MRYRAQCAFCPDGCKVSTAKDAQTWKNHHSRITEHVVTIAEVTV
jgi:hypothetical protein